MCENQNMEKKQEEMKVVHSQHTRILKEDDEIWISSEDLNTENSSDDDRSKTKHAFKKKLKLKDRKRSSPNIKLQRPSIPSAPCTSEELDDRLLMPTVDDPHSKSTDESRTSDEECHMPPPIPTECLTKRMSLEDWRPTRGALDISTLDETTSSAGEVRKIVKETGNFYNAMLHKLKSLKSCSVLKSVREEKSEAQGKLPAVGKTFKYLKETPEVKKKLDFIKMLDEEINETISRYKAERDDRLSAEFKMCKDIREQNPGVDRETETFLQMCNFEERLTKSREELEGKSDLNTAFIGPNDAESVYEVDSNGEYCAEATKIVDRGNLTGFTEITNRDCTKSVNFISKNVHAAKEGPMASFALTDEEKVKVAQLLQDIDDFQLNDADLTLSSSSLTESAERCDENANTRGEENENDRKNAFSVSEKDQLRMGEIDCELEKFAEDDESKGNAKKEIAVVKDEEFWKKYVLDRSLKEIDAKLEKLYASYAEDEEKLTRTVSSEALGEEETELQQLGINVDNY